MFRQLFGAHVADPIWNAEEQNRKNNRKPELETLNPKPQGLKERVKAAGAVKHQASHGLTRA